MKADQIYSGFDGGRLKLPKHIVQQILTYFQVDSFKFEAGGVLLGRYLIGSQDVVVDQITTPMSEDRQSRHRFFRSRIGHQALVDMAWHRTQGTRNYLGEWHTHAEPVPKPSQIDFLNWHRLLAFYRHDPDPLYFVIAGTKAIGVWQGYKNGFIDALTLQATNDYETNFDN